MSLTILYISIIFSIICFYITCKDFKVLLLYIKLPNQKVNYLKDVISQENGDYELKDHTFEVLLSSSGYENKVQTQRGMEEKLSSTFRV